MSDKTFGPDDPLSRESVATAVSAARPDWTLVAAEPIPEGSDVLYRVRVATAEASAEPEVAADSEAVGDPEVAVDVEGASDAEAASDPEMPSDARTADRTAVLKCFRQTGPLTFRSATDFLTEVGLLELVSTETAVPVPTVYGACESIDDDSVPTPLFLMEHVDGINAETVPADDDPAVAERIASESGRYLARIHDCRSFEAFGSVVVSDDVDVGSDEEVRADDLAVADGYDDVTDHLRDGLEYALDNLDETRFADLEGPLREYVDDRLAAFDHTIEPVLLHGDYRRGNLLVDPESGAIEAVLDWGATIAGDPLDELTTVEADLAGKAPPDAPVRRRVRQALFEAYERERGREFDRDASFADRRRLYRFSAWVTELRWFPYWHEGRSEAARDERAAWLRAAVRSRIDGDHPPR